MTADSKRFQFHLPLIPFYLTGTSSLFPSCLGLGTGAPVIESPYGDNVRCDEAPESISRAVASLPPEQMFELMKQMKVRLFHVVKTDGRKQQMLSYCIVSHMTSDALYLF